MNEIQIIAEIGINANGDINLAKKLIDIAKFAGCNYVKFQKRNPDKCVPDEQKNVMRKTPWGEMRYIDYRYKLEFNEKEYDEIDNYCKRVGIKWFASAWDDDSIYFLKHIGCDIIKIPSALAVDKQLMKLARENTKNLFVSTGMLNESDVEYIIKEIGPNVLFHTNSTYPCPPEQLNLNYIKWLQDTYCKKYNIEVGYSGHEFGLTTTFAAAALGVSWIERHITLDRMSWGSDQMASVEPSGLIKLVKGIRDIEKAMGKMEPRQITEGELLKLKSLRK